MADYFHTATAPVSIHHPRYVHHASGDVHHQRVFRAPSVRRLCATIDLKMSVGSKTLLQQAAQDLEVMLGYQYNPGKPTLKEYSSAKRTLLKIKVAGKIAELAQIPTKVTMDKNEYTCGTCRHGRLYGYCQKCEDAAEKADTAVQAYKAKHHERNDAQALALQMRQPNNGDFV